VLLIARGDEDGELMGGGSVVFELDGSSLEGGPGARTVEAELEVSCGFWVGLLLVWIRFRHVVRIIGSVRVAVVLFRCVVALALPLVLAGCNRGDHPGQIAQVAPDITVHNGSQTIRLSQFRGKIVLLNFWATWCAPCIDELPSLQALQKARPDIQVLAVSIDDDPAAYAAFLKQYDISLLSARDGSQGANLKYGSVKVPETFVIGRDGVIKRKFISSQDWTNPEVLGYLAKL
jgi:cytochrome c biogenesis protein CcmG/thiol:disulfide interchange protein DsbE